MGLCASKKEDVAEPKQMEEKEKKDVSSGDEGSEDEDIEDIQTQGVGDQIIEG